jgi:tRNA-dihydrouridine synthase
MLTKSEVSFAEHIKKAVPNLLIGAVGIITEPEQANDILENDQADITLFARQILRDVDFPLRAAQELGVAVNPSLQYGAAWSRMLVPRKPNEVHHSEAKEHGTQRGEGEVEGEESEKTKGGRGSKCPPPVFACILPGMTAICR